MKLQVGDLVRTKGYGDRIVVVLETYPDGGALVDFDDGGCEWHMYADELTFVFRPTAELPEKQFLIGDVVKDGAGEVFEVASRTDDEGDQWLLLSGGTGSAWRHFESLELVYRRSR